MRHARPDYERFQDPALRDPSLLSPGSTPIAEDEPVFLLRAQDVCAPQVVDDYADAAFRVGASPALVERCRQWAAHMRVWQVAHRTKVPDAPVDAPMPDPGVPREAPPR